MNGWAVVLTCGARHLCRFIMAGQILVEAV
jgi:hypothetical protein